MGATSHDATDATPTHWHVLDPAAAHIRGRAPGNGKADSESNDSIAGRERGLTGCTGAPFCESTVVDKARYSTDDREEGQVALDTIKAQTQRPQWAVASSVRNPKLPAADGDLVGLRRDNLAVGVVRSQPNIVCRQAPSLDDCRFREACCELAKDNLGVTNVGCVGLPSTSHFSPSNLSGGVIDRLCTLRDCSDWDSSWIYPTIWTWFPQDQ